MLIITLVIAYAWFVWFVSRFLRLASLPDRLLKSEGAPNVATEAEESSTPTTQD